MKKSTNIMILGISIMLLGIYINIDLGLSQAFGGTKAFITIAGFIVCLIGFFMGLFYKDTKEELLINLKKRIDTPVETWNCPKCKVRNPNTYYSCEKCGYQIK